MRVLSAPKQMHGLSGFDLEVVGEVGVRRGAEVRSGRGTAGAPQAAAPGAPPGLAEAPVSYD